MTSLLIDADSACYTAKNAGRNRIHIHQPGVFDNSHHHTQMQCVNMIQHALEHDNFQIWAQYIAPVKRIEQGIHLEILLRLKHPDKGILSPGSFLPTAERFNLATRIDRWVISHTLKWFTNHPQAIEETSLLAINLSGQSLSDTSLFDFIAQELEITGFPRHKLCFEITETAAIGNLEEAKKFINNLKKMGCLFSLDDFGSGLSSFAYLKNLAVDFLKIDGQFVKDMADDPIDYAMVKSINEIGQVMGKKTIAEFVENDGVLVCLKQLGVDYAQGYNIGKPQPIQQIFEEI